MDRFIERDRARPIPSGMPVTSAPILVADRAGVARDAGRRRRAQSVPVADPRGDRTPDLDGTRRERVALAISRCRGPAGDEDPRDREPPEPPTHRPASSRALSLLRSRCSSATPVARGRDCGASFAARGRASRSTISSWSTWPVRASPRRTTRSARRNGLADAMSVRRSIVFRVAVQMRSTSPCRISRVCASRACGNGSSDQEDRADRSGEGAGRWRRAGACRPRARGRSDRGSARGAPGGAALRSWLRARRRRGPGASAGTRRSTRCKRQPRKERGVLEDDGAIPGPATSLSAG